MEAMLVMVIAVCLTAPALGWAPASQRAFTAINRAHNSQHTTTRPMRMSPATASATDNLDALLAIKREEVAALRQEIEGTPDHPVARLLQEPSSKRAAGRLAKLLKKPKGCMSSIGQFRQINRSDELKGVIFSSDISDPKQISRKFRDGNCAAAFAVTDIGGGGSYENLREMAKEQQSAKGDFPGPVPILQKDLVIDRVQLAAAAEAGSTGTVLTVAAVDSEVLKDLVQFSEALGMDVILEVANEEEVNAAKELGVKVLKLTVDSMDKAEKLQELVPADCVSVLDSPDVIDIQACWRMRSAGINSMVFTDVLWQYAVDERVDFTAVLKAMQSKGSVKFGNHAQLGREEGAKETLGELMF